jgi:hypothetical protein
LRIKVAAVLFWISVAWFVAVYAALAAPTAYWFNPDNELTCLFVSAPILNFAQFPGGVLVLVSIMLDFRWSRLLAVFAMMAFGVAGWGGCEVLRAHLRHPPGMF